MSLMVIQDMCSCWQMVVCPILKEFFTWSRKVRNIVEYILLGLEMAHHMIWFRDAHKMEKESLSWLPIMRIRLKRLLSYLKLLWHLWLAKSVSYAMMRNRLKALFRIQNPFLTFLKMTLPISILLLLDHWQRRKSSLSNMKIQSQNFLTKRISKSNQLLWVSSLLIKWLIWKCWDRCKTQQRTE